MNLSDSIKNLKNKIEDINNKVTKLIESSNLANAKAKDNETKVENVINTADNNLKNINEINNKIEALTTSQSLEYGGKSITCENTLASRTSDMLIKGKTYKNLFRRINSQTTQEQDNNYVLTGVASVYSILSIYPAYNLPKNNKYTVIIDVKDINVSDGKPFKFDGFNGNTWVCGTKIETTGLKKILLQGNQDITEIKLQINNGVNCNITISKNIIILEGDWKNKEVPASITGIESAGQKENKISILSKNNKSADDINYKEYKKEILLPIDGGLKSLPNGVYDTIEQRADGIYLVQKVGKYDIKENDEIKIDSSPNQQNTIAFAVNVKAKNIKNVGDNICNNFNRFTSGDLYWNSDKEGILNSSNSQFKFRILKSKLSTQDIAGIKVWLKANPTTVCYETNTPVETKLDINNLDLEVYKDITYVTTDNAIKPTLSFKVPSNIGGVIQSNSQNVNKLYKLIDEDIEISGSVEQMKLNDTIFPLANNQTVQLEVTKNFEGAVIYETSDSAVATVSTSGLITKKANGKATITAKCKNKSVSCEVVDLITNDSWVLQSLNIPYLHSRGITGKGVKVAVIDSRVSSIPNKLTIAKTVSFCTNDNSGVHGYNVASIIGSKEFGVAPDSDIYSLEVGDTTGEDTMETVISAIDWCIQNNIDIINLSMGFMTYYEPLKNKCYEAYSKNITIVCASGNNGKFGGTVGYPAKYFSCISINNVNENGVLAETSSYGNSIDFTSYGESIFAYDKNGNKISVSGTSFSCPVATGIIALLKQQNKSLKPREIYELLKENSMKLDNFNKSEKFGYGLIKPFIVGDYRKQIELDAEDLKKNIYFTTHLYEIKSGEDLQTDLRFLPINEINGKLEYKSTDSDIFSVDDDGKITGRKNGKASLIAIMDYSKVATVDVKVFGQVVSKENPLFNELNIPSLHSKGITGKGVKVAYLGYGCTTTEKIKVTKKIVIPTSGCTKEDGNGFGTIFCSLLTGKDIGICPDIELYDVKISDDNAAITWADAKKGLQWCYNNDIDIVNLMYVNANDDSVKTLVNQCINKGMLLISNDASEPSGNSDLDKSENTLTVSYVQDDKTFLDGNPSKTPPKGSWVDCVGYGWGLQIIDSKLEQHPYGNGEWPVHQYYCNFAMAQVMGICALIKQQNPNLKTARDIRPLLSELCEPLYGGKNDKTGYGLLKAKILMSDTN